MANKSPEELAAEAQAKLDAENAAKLAEEQKLKDDAEAQAKLDAENAAKLAEEQKLKDDAEAQAKLDKKGLVKVVANYPVTQDKATLWGVDFVKSGKDEKSVYVAEVDEATAESLLSAERATKAK